MAANTPRPSGGKHLTLSFGLVQVGVKYLPFKRDQRIKGHYVDPDSLGPVHQQYVNEAGGVVKPVSAYEFEGREIVLGDRDALKSDRDGRLELRAFVDPLSVDPLYMESSYVLSPAEGQESGYDLLCSVLRQTGKALMGTSVLVGAKSTRAVMVRFFRESLIAHVCTYDANIDWNTQALVSKAYGERPQPDPSLEQMAMQVIASLPETFDLSSVTDEYDERVREAIEAEAKGVKPKRAPAPEPKPVSDLMAALVASVEAVKGEKKPARKRVKA